MSRFESVDSFATPPHSRKRSRSLPARLRLSAADSEHEQPDGDIVMSEPKSTRRRLVQRHTVDDPTAVTLRGTKLYQCTEIRHAT